MNDRRVADWPRRACAPPGGSVHDTLVSGRFRARRLPSPAGQADATTDQEPTFLTVLRRKVSTNRDRTHFVRRLSWRHADRGTGGARPRGSPDRSGALAGRASATTSPADSDEGVHERPMARRVPGSARAGRTGDWRAFRGFEPELLPVLPGLATNDGHPDQRLALLGRATRRRRHGGCFTRSSCSPKQRSAARSAF